MLFKLVVVTVLLYGPNNWALTKTLPLRFHGTHAKMLSSKENIMAAHVANEELYTGLSKLSSLITEQRWRVRSHYYWSRNEVM